MNNYAALVLIPVVIVFVIGRRFAGQPLRSQTPIIPVALTVWAGYNLVKVHLTAIDLGFIAVCLVLGVISGLARGVTVHLYPRDGHLWTRYRWTTAVIWVATIALRVGLVAVGHVAGVGLNETWPTVLTLGVSLVVEAVVVGLRAARTGVPLAPGRRAAVIGGRLG
jgi:hypothetical protein